MKNFQYTIGKKIKGTQQKNIVMEFENLVATKYHRKTFKLLPEQLTLEL